MEKPKKRARLRRFASMVEGDFPATSVTAYARATRAETVSGPPLRAPGSYLADYFEKPAFDTGVFRARGVDVKVILDRSNRLSKSSEREHVEEHPSSAAHPRLDRHEAPDRALQQSNDCGRPSCRDGSFNDANQGERNTENCMVLDRRMSRAFFDELIATSATQHQR